MTSPRQYVLGFAGTPSFAREDFVVTETNRAAVTLIERWPSWPGVGVALVGPEGSGKSHLAAIWERLSAARRWTGSLDELAAISAAVQPPVLLVEDADRGWLDQDALFHALDLVMRRRGSMLLTGRRHPAAWPFVLPDLVSRLRAFPVVELAAPDDELMSAVLAKQFADRQVLVDAGVIAYLVARIERSLAAVASTVEELDNLALAEGRRITRVLAARVVDRGAHGGTGNDFDPV